MPNFADNYGVTLPPGPGEVDTKRLDFADNYRVTLPIGQGEAEPKRLDFADNYPDSDKIPEFVFG